MSKLFRTVNYTNKTVPQVEQFEDEFTSQVNNINSLDDENFLQETRLQESMLALASFEARKLFIDYHFSEQTTTIVLSSSFQDLTGTELNVPIIVPSTLFIMAGFQTPIVNPTRTWTGRFLVDGSANEDVVQLNGTSAEFKTVHIVTLVNANPGTTALKLQAKISSETPNQINSWIMCLVSSQ